jgi:hypothetical protein
MNNAKAIKAFQRLTDPEMAKMDTANNSHHWGATIAVAYGGTF